MDDCKTEVKESSEQSDELEKAFAIGMAIGFGKKYDEMDKIMEMIKALMPKPKTAHWIRWYEQKETDWYIENTPHCKCSECGKEYDPHSSKFIKYCNECGAKIVERQESEENNG